MEPTLAKDDAAKKMVLMVKCLICNTKLEYHKQDTGTLIQHIRDEHPNLTVNLLRMKPTVTMDNGNQTGDAAGKLVGTKSSGKVVHYNSPIDKTIENDEANVLFKREYKPKKALKAQPPGSRKLYKTSIEKWKPGEGRITCPQCGQTGRPTIRMHADKVTSSPLGATCIMTCWPFCFLPCLFPPPMRENLHCSVCNHFLGVYDHRKEVISPNVADVDSGRSK